MTFPPTMISIVSPGVPWPRSCKLSPTWRTLCPTVKAGGTRVGAVVAVGCMGAVGVDAAATGAETTNFQGAEAVTIEPSATIDCTFTV